MLPAITALLRAALLLVVLFAPWLASAADKHGPWPEIEYASPDQSVWTTRTTAQGEPENPLRRVAGALFAKAGIAWHGQAYPAARMFNYLRQGKVQFSMLVKSPALQDCCLLSRQPITFAEIRAYYRSGTAPINNPGDLAGKNIITIHGYSYGGLLGRSEGNAGGGGSNLALTHSAAFQMLAQGRADYLVDYVGPASEVLAATPLPGLQSEVLSRQAVYLVLSKTYPDAEKVMARLESIAETLDIERLMRGNKK